MGHRETMFFARFRTSRSFFEKKKFQPKNLEIFFRPPTSPEAIFAEFYFHHFRTKRVGACMIG